MVSREGNSNADASGHAHQLLTVTISEEAGQELNVAIGGELDMSNVEDLDARVSPALDRRPSKLVVDARELRFADSSGIALWVRWADRVDSFELRDPPALLRRVIDAMGLADKLVVRT